MYFQNWHKPGEVKRTALEKHVGRWQRGAIAPLAAVLMLMLFGFAALAVDLGYLYVVRNQLQNAADAAVLAGANYLYPRVNGEPNFALAAVQARSAIALNTADNAILHDDDSGSLEVTTGYWDVTGAVPDVKPTPQGGTPLSAVKVKIIKASNNSNGAVNTLFAKIFGVDSMNLAATAVAVVAPPGVTTKDLFPVAITKCMYDNYWDSSTNEPIDDPATGVPYIFNIGSSYHYSGCDAGQWTSLYLDSNNVPTIKNLIDYASGTPNPSPPNPPLAVGGNIWIEPGTKNALYNPIDNCSAAGDGSCEYQMVPVVCFDPAGSPACGSLDTHTQTAIKGFACIHILSATGGSTKAISVQMLPSDTTVNGVQVCKMPGGGIGPDYGVYEPPKLANYWGNTY